MEPSEGECVGATALLVNSSSDDSHGGVAASRIGDMNQATKHLHAIDCTVEGIG